MCLLYETRDSVDVRDAGHPREVLLEEIGHLPYKEDGERHMHEDGATSLEFSTEGSDCEQV